MNNLNNNFNNNFKSVDRIYKLHELFGVTSNRSKNHSKEAVKRSNLSNFNKFNQNKAA